MKTKSFFTIIIILTFFSCKLFETEYDEFTLKKQNYTGNELRIDGYYYREFESDCQSLKIYFLYRNGIILRGGNPCIDEIGIRENEFSNGEWSKYVEEDEISWGVFVIENDTIKFERYNPPSGPGYLHSLVREGPIINDTTFRIIRLYWFKDGEKIITETDDLYHFKKFAPKPDSTNNFIN